VPVLLKVFLRGRGICCRCYAFPGTGNNGNRTFSWNSHPGTWTLFRDYLITHPEPAKKYGELKIRIREKSGFDREVYTRENGIHPGRGATGAGGRR
jgi:hypothetical protein